MIFPGGMEDDLKERLENQALTSSDLAEERERMIAELLAGPPARLWDEV